MQTTMFSKVNSVWPKWLYISNRTDDVYGEVLTVLAPLLIILWFIFVISRHNKPPLPPGPRGLPFVGYLPFLGSDLRWTFSNLAGTYGPIFKVRLGTKNCIVVSSPALVKEVLRDQDAIFANRDPSIAARIITFGAPDIAFSDYSPEWRKMRKIFASEMLSNAGFDASYRLRQQQVKKMINETYKKADGLVDLSELIFLTIINSIICMVWGDMLERDDGAAIGPEFRAVVAEHMLLLGAPNISDYVPLLARFDLQGIGARMKLVSTHYGNIFDSAINRCNNGKYYEQKGFLGHLLQLTKHEDPAISLTLPQVKAMLMDVVIGGMDTTATTIEWAMAELLQHPNVMRNVQKELTEVVGLDNAVEEAHLPNLKYLSAILKETLRLHAPAALLIPHSSSKSTTVGGYTIPKGSQVFFNAWAIHRDPQLWEDTLIFQPERFLSESSSGKLDFLGSNLQYFPFGSGRRMCPGITLAEKAAMHVLAALLHSFEWILPNGTLEVDFSEIFGIVLKKSKPLIAVPSPRLSSSQLYTEED